MVSNNDVWVGVGHQVRCTRVVRTLNKSCVFWVCLRVDLAQCEQADVNEPELTMPIFWSDLTGSSLRRRGPAERRRTVAVSPPSLKASEAGTQARLIL